MPHKKGIPYPSDILIWVFRRNARAARHVEEGRVRYVSVVSLMELIKGARDSKEIRLIKEFLSDFGFQTIPLTENVGHRAVIYIELHAPKSGLRLADALITATAVKNNLPLLSGDTRHYQVLRDLDLVAFRP